MTIVKNLAFNGRESTVNRALDGSIYPGYKLAPSSQKIVLLGVRKHNNLYLRLVLPSSRDGAPLMFLDMRTDV